MRSSQDAIKLVKKPGVNTPLFNYCNYGDEFAATTMKQGTSDPIFKDQVHQISAADIVISVGISDIIEDKTISDDSVMDMEAVKLTIDKPNSAAENAMELREVENYKNALDDFFVLAITDQKGIIKHVNNKFCTVSKYTFEELMGQDYSIVNSGYSPTELIYNLWTTIAKGKISQGELMNKAKDLSTYWTHTTIIPILNEQDNPYQYIVISSVIAKPSRLAKSITTNGVLALQNEEKEKQLAELFVANKQLAFQNEEKEKRAAELIIANRELVFQNKEKEKRALELITANRELAFQSEEREKRAVELIIANTEHAFQDEKKEKRSAELVVANTELAFQNKEKARETEELLIANEELKILQQQFKEANEELESFSYSISHDLRAPLRAVYGYTKKLERNFEALLDPEAHRLMNNIMDNAKRMGQLIDDLLNFSRIARRELVKVNVNMQSIVTNLCDELIIEQGDRNIEFCIKELLPAKADNFAIKQVWLNLIANAIKYTRLKEFAYIEIGNEVINEEIIYYVKDNGAGFNMRYADKLFGVFQRLHTAEEYEGTGVGLAIVQRIILKHGGRVWANAMVNEGATFYFTLNKL